MAILVNGVPDTRSVNTKALNKDISINAEDIGAVSNTGGSMNGNFTLNGQLNVTSGVIRSKHDTSGGFHLGGGSSGDGYSELAPINKTESTPLWADSLRYYPSSNSLDWRFGTSKIYHERNKPSASDVGALPSTGGAITGTLTINNSNQSYGINQLSNVVTSDKKYLREFRSHSVGTIWHETVQEGIYRLATGSTDSNEVLKVLGSGEGYLRGSRIYTEGFKPTASDIGAVSRGGDTVTGDFKVVTNGSTGLTVSGTTYPGIKIESRSLTNERQKILEVNNEGHLNIITRNEGGSNNGVITIPKNVNGTVYTTGNKPTAADLNVLPLTGGTMSGVLISSRRVGQFQGALCGGTSIDDLYSTEAGQWSYVSNISKGPANLFPATNNANSMLTFNSHPGEYGHQLGFSSNGRMYHRWWKSSGWNEIVLSQGGNISTTTLSASGGISGGSLSVVGSATVGERVTANEVVVTNNCDLRGVVTAGSFASKNEIRLKAAGGSTGDIYFRNWGNVASGRSRILELNDGDGYYFYCQRQTDNRVLFNVNGSISSGNARLGDSGTTVSLQDGATLGNGPNNALLRGAIDGGSWTTWKDRASGLHINVNDAANKAYNVWKVSQPGRFTFASMQAHCPGSDVSQTTLKLFAGDKYFDFQGDGIFSADKIDSRGDTTVRGYLFATGGEICVNKNGRRHYSFANGAGVKDFYIYKDVGGDGIHLNNGADGGSDWIFKKDGSLYAPGNGDFNDIHVRSDKRLKSDLKEIKNALSKVNSLTGYVYNKHQSLEDRTLIGKEAGIIAQDLKEVLPEAVNEMEDSTLTISSAAVNGLLVEAIKELTERVSNLEKIIGGK